ncbi:MAG: [citrate (pro-3S)-lyase] ligase [Lachnospiraceae bacterium]|nr:[citrate (pro-3S)-lyase] ligase [Lachnospiraceae bacterium]
MSYTLSEIKKDDKRNIRKQKELLLKEGIDRDGNLDYTVGLFDEDYNLVATGSLFKNTLRCMAVDSDHQGEGLMNDVVTHLVAHELERGYTHLFLYTKIDSAKFFGDLGFYEIARVDGKLVFMENRKNGFDKYIEDLSNTKVEGNSIASIVMNANPFTLGHRYLVERAAKENDYVHVFVVSEDASEVPFSVRYELVKQGVKDLENVIVHESGAYIISSATFPSYFLKDEKTVAQSHARLDIEVFKSIAKALDITSRYVGTEPFSEITGLYNEVMQQELPGEGITCHVIERKETEKEAISASRVRALIKEKNFEELKCYVPQSTYAYFAGEGKKVPTFEEAKADLKNRQEVDLPMMLSAREQRVMHQMELLKQYGEGTVLICFTMNMAGPVKYFELLSRAFEKGKEEIESTLKNMGAPVLHHESHQEVTGVTAFYAVCFDPMKVKEAMVHIEDGSSLGRLFDIDVLVVKDGEETKLSREDIGMGERSCLVCKKPGSECARSRAHSVKELQDKSIEVMIQGLS